MKDSGKIINLMLEVERVAKSLKDSSYTYELKMLHDTMDTMVHNLRVDNK